MNLLRSMSKYLLIGIAQSYILITGNIDLSIGSMVGMSAMVAATLMSRGVHPIVAIVVALLCCLVCGVINGFLVGKFKLPPFIATLGTMFITRGVAYMVNGNRNTDAIATGIGKEAGDSFQNIFYYGSTLGVYNTFWIALLFFVIFFFLLSKTRTVKTYIRYRFQHRRGEALRRECGGNHDKGLSGQRGMFLCGRTDPLCTGGHG